MTMSNGKVKVTLNRSVHGQLQNIRASVYGLGLRRIRDVKFVEDTPGRARHDQRRQAPARRRKGLRSEDMRLNTIKPGPGSKRKRLRVGAARPPGRARPAARAARARRPARAATTRSASKAGQVPLQRRLPKVGFRSAIEKSRAGSDADRP
jgi:ribosomal protein L30/L7E